MAARSGIFGLGSRLYPGNMQRIFNKDLTRFMQSLSRERQNRASKRKALLAGWLHQIPSTNTFVGAGSSPSHVLARAVLFRFSSFSTPELFCAMKQRKHWGREWIFVCSADFSAGSRWLLCFVGSAWFYFVCSVQRNFCLKFVRRLCLQCAEIFCLRCAKVFFVFSVRGIFFFL